MFYRQAPKRRKTWGNLPLYSPSQRTWALKKLTQCINAFKKLML